MDNDFTTFKGWLVLLHKTCVAVPGLTFNKIFSLLEILFPIGLTYEGKLKGTRRQNCSCSYSIFWDQLALTERKEPPSTFQKWKIGTKCVKLKIKEQKWYFLRQNLVLINNLWNFEGVYLASQKASILSFGHFFNAFYIISFDQLRTIWSSTNFNLNT